MSDTELPVQSVLADIRDGLRRHDQLVLQAPPGAGKTTLVPLALLDEDWLRRAQGRVAGRGGRPAGRLPHAAGIEGQPADPHRDHDRGRARPPAVRRPGAGGYRPGHLRRIPRAQPRRRPRARAVPAGARGVPRDAAQAAGHVGDAGGGAHRRADRRPGDRQRGPAIPGGDSPRQGAAAVRAPRRRDARHPARRDRRASREQHPGVPTRAGRHPRSRGVPGRL